MNTLNMSNHNLMSALPEIAEKHLGVTISQLRFVGGGSNGKVFKASSSDGRTVALKAYRKQGSQQEEAYQLKILSANTSVNMPEVLFTHTDEKTAVMGMSFIDGHNVLNPVFLFKNKSQKIAFAQNVVDGMSQWHEVSGKKFGPLQTPEYDSWHEYYRNEKQQPWLSGLAALSQNGKFSKKKLELLYSATDIFDKVCEEPESPVLIHGDLNIMNIMANPKNLKLNGFIDPCGSIWADREYDLFQLRNMWGDKFYLYETYKSVHKTSEHTDFKVAYYGAMNECACRLGSGLIMPLWEELCINRLKKEMKKY